MLTGKNSIIKAKTRIRECDESKSDLCSMAAVFLMRIKLYASLLNFIPKGLPDVNGFFDFLRLVKSNLISFVMFSKIYLSS